MTTTSWTASSPASSFSLDINQLKNADEIKAAFLQLSKEEEAVDAELEHLLSQQMQLETQLRSLSSSLPQLKSAQIDAAKLASTISFTAKLAEGVSVKVKQLDLAKSRVSECQQRVNDLIDLKLCSDGVKTALIEEDYEQAAAHLHRFLAMDEGLLKLTASEMRDESGEGGMASLEAALKTLHEAETKVKEVVAKRFDEAVAEEDLASIERFFKLFPLINMHSEGLKKFALYLCEKLVEASKKNLKQAVETSPSDLRANVIFADTLTLLFEGIARTVEIHQPLIETYYGPGRLLNVLTMLQEECDRQAHKILQEFRKKRNVKEQASRVKEAMYGGGGGSSGGGQQKVAAKEIDHVLSEMTLLQARSEMYYRFIRKRITADLEVSSDNETFKGQKLAEMEKLITRSGLCHSMQDLLAEYILLEDYFMGENIRMAMLNDSMYNVEEDQLTSVMLDDVFFILKKCVQRSISGQNVDGVCAVVNNACRISEQDFCGLLQNQLKMGFPTGYLDLTHAYNVIHSSYQQGKLQGGDTEKQKAVFLTALNNTDSASDYILRLSSTLQQDVRSMLGSRSAHERDKLENCLGGFPAVSGKLKSVLEQGLQQLRQSAIRPRIKPWMDAFISHEINEEQFADFEANDPFVQTLILNLDGLLGGFKKALTPNNYDALVSILTNEVTSQLEKAVLKSKFSRLGGLLLDREVRSLVSFLTSVTTWTIRDKFAKLTQIATVLNLESVGEMSDIWGANSGGVTWRLNSSEIRQILGLRIDFQTEDIKRLRL